MAEPCYPTTAVNKLGRLAKRGSYDYRTIHTILNTCPILHVSFNDPDHPFPVVLPMIGCTGNFENQDADPLTTEQDLYIHGYVSGRMFRKGKEATTGEGEEGEGLPITVAASFLDGLVLSLTPFHNSLNYRSATAQGHATLLSPTTSQPEINYALKLITNSLAPTRWENSRLPPTPAELKSTSILKIRIQTASAKVRTGGPSEDRKDLKDGELVGRVWTGVVPYWGVWGEPVGSGVPGGREDVEGYIEEWRVGENARAEEYAIGAVAEGGK
ncbi:5-nitroimidazole antibiotic resistance protein [Plenodomus tracheiphilus IPT5]|uniref:5-nitroimidazole antibiotic resistance protein n=1 Tax=Plenodomus tracheiphilus IPT5 TaxID=1408161 RepID=A0A6A7B455_9PLEO|nr:5-nitroimidazole antibiotic resistance protein [Plenodomus tracheiphilus IPT5]